MKIGLDIGSKLEYLRVLSFSTMLKGCPSLMTQSIQPNKLFACLLHEDFVEKFSDPEHEPRGVQIINIIPLNGGLNLGRVVFFVKRSFKS